MKSDRIIWLLGGRNPFARIAIEVIHDPSQGQGEVMAKAEALFKRHSKEFAKLFNIDHLSLDNTEHRIVAVVIFGACIIAEAIRSEQDEAEFKEPHP